MGKASTTERLSAKQARFIEEYLLDGNATQAAIRAGYSPKTANEQGTQLLVKLRHIIDPRLAQQVADLQQRTQITREEWLKKAERFFHADIRKLFDSHGNPIEVHELGDNEAPFIEGFEFYADFEGKGESRKACGYTKKYKLTKPRECHEYVGKVMGWRTPLKFADDAVQARKEMEQAFLRGDLNADDLGVLLRSRDLQLKIAEHEALKDRIAGLEAKLDKLLARQGRA